jgi:hypothetical protein
MESNIIYDSNLKIMPSPYNSPAKKSNSLFCSPPVIKDWDMDDTIFDLDSEELVLS